MKKLFLIVLACSMAGGLAAPAFASDWDVAGKVLTGIEGLRIVTGGRVDPVGSMINVVFGSSNGRQESYGNSGHGRVYARRERGRRVWVPHYVWVREYVPQHQEYIASYGGMVIVEGHYIQRRVEQGGHWEIRYDHDSGGRTRDRYDLE